MRPGAGVCVTFTFLAVDSFMHKAKDGYTWCDKPKYLTASFNAILLFTESSQLCKGKISH